MAQQVEQTIKGKTLEFCVVPACVHGVGTLALTEKQEGKVQIAQNNWIRRICNVKREN